ncbi:ABC-type multidrug transport system, ATPase component [Alteracholeplasma palmae J233]|uniref:ABC-type multidrug transport system, ATPase component n=1 Tax=Alteracholeplasma palmae (strain ATCC 49389 / J233) TaxID=1318466 RepID=U4KK93_ALTPJ|nr:ABC transporter ATP-binding protein [Alteracholeplasma palmae]CCV63933.1 ABC-type multidrug transport system, ATPase component [Alteracholeplasma palmae J233]
MDYIIQTTNLTKSYNNFQAVKGIDFKVKRGGLFAFLGLNGAGKSTTINILCSIIQKDSGKIMIDGLDLDKDVNKIKEKVGIVFQRSVLDLQLTVLQNLLSRASLYPLTKEQTHNRIQYLTEILELESILNRQYGQLSGGQKRKVDIARALLHEPKILFLDEPTTGLDPNTRIAVWEMLDKLMKDKELTIFLTTHYMEEVVNANHVVILDEGKIVAEGTPDELKDIYANDILRIINKKDEKIDQILKQFEKDYTYNQGIYLVKVKDSLDALEIINQNKELLSNFEILKGNMDQVFLNATGKKLEVKNEE